MKILFLSHYFPPEVNAPASRTFEHCREWVRAGHEVTVVTCAPNHPRGEVYEGYVNRLRYREAIDDVVVIRLWTYVSANEGFGKRSLNYLSFMLACIFAAPTLSRADVVISTSPQFFNGLAGFFVSRMKRCPWVLEIRDLWPESILALGAIRNRALIGVLRWLEGFSYRKAERIVPVTDVFRQSMLDAGVDPGKIVVVKDGVELALFDRAQPGDALRRRLDLEDQFVAAYFGTHGMAHHLETIFEAASLLSDDSRIVFLMVGDGAEKARLSAMREQLGLENVLMLDQQPKSMMPEFWALADTSLVLLSQRDVFRTVIPSKIFEAMGMATPIVLGVDGEAREIVEAAGGGIAIEPENANQLADAVRRLSENPDIGAEMGSRGYEYVRTHFDRRKLARRYLDVLEDVAAAPA